MTTNNQIKLLSLMEDWSAGMTDFEAIIAWIDLYLKKEE